MEINTIKVIRCRIDGLTQLICQLPASREVSLARTGSQLSKMWLGKTLQAMEVANPYPESKDPSSQTIEKTADVSLPLNFPADFTTISKVKLLRSGISELEKQLVWDKQYPANDGYSHWKKDEEIILALRLAKQYLTEAGMWLGMNLQNLV